MNNPMGNVIAQAVGAIKSFGATDALMQNLYQNNPEVRRTVDQFAGRSIDDLLRERGIDPNEVRRMFGIR